MQSALDVEKEKSNRSISLGIIDFTQWMRKNSVNPDTLISDPGSSTSSSDIHHLLAHNALVKVRSENWSSAYEDAHKVISHSIIAVLMSTHPHLKSIVTRPSAMAHIVQALAQIGMGQTEEALRVFDLAFGNCHSKESNLILLIKVYDPYASLIQLNTYVT